MITQKRKGPYPGWHDFVAGAAAGAGARIMTHPLDLIRIRRQLGGGNKTTTTFVHDMWLVVKHEGGIRGLFRGNLAAINLWVSYTGVQFYAYASSKHYFQGTLFPHENQQTLVAFCAGASAGVAATVTTYPLDLCRTIFAAKGADMGAEPPPQQTTKSTLPAQPQQQSSSFRAPKSTWEFATQLYRNRGWRGFYAGCTPTVLQIIPYMGSSFAIYDSLTRGDRDIGLSAYAGSIAGAVSKTLVYPMDTVKKRLQAQTFYDTHGYYYASIMDCVTTIYQREGVWAFYNGLVPSVLKTALAAGLSFMFFRSVKNLLESIHDRPFTKADPPTRRNLTTRMTTGN